MLLMPASTEKSRGGYTLQGEREREGGRATVGLSEDSQSAPPSLARAEDRKSKGGLKMGKEGFFVCVGNKVGKSGKK